MTAVRLRYNQARVLWFGTTTKLVPGVNRLREARFAELKNHPLFLKKVESGVIQILDGLPEEQPVQVTTSIKPQQQQDEQPRKRGRRTIEDIIAEVNDTFDHAALKEWMLHKNDSVKAAAKARLKAVGPSDPVPQKKR